jgi:hypothetical protein
MHASCSAVGFFAKLDTRKQTANVRVVVILNVPSIEYIDYICDIKYMTQTFN